MISGKTSVRGWHCRCAVNVLCTWNSKLVSLPLCGLFWLWWNYLEWCECVVVVQIQFVVWLLKLHMVVRVRELHKRSTVSAHSVVICADGKYKIVCHSKSATQTPSKTKYMTSYFFVGSYPHNIFVDTCLQKPQILFFFFWSVHLL